eukprot:838235-Prymnesium_polylepis.1
MGCRRPPPPRDGPATAIFAAADACACGALGLLWRDKFSVFMVVLLRCSPTASLREGHVVLMLVHYSILL